MQLHHVCNYLSTRAPNSLDGHTHVKQTVLEGEMNMVSRYRLPFTEVKGYETIHNVSMDQSLCKRNRRAVLDMLTRSQIIPTTSTYG